MDPRGPQPRGAGRHRPGVPQEVGLLVLAGGAAAFNRPFYAILVLPDQAGIDRGPLAAIAAIPLDKAGYAIVALFVLAWLTALAVRRFERIEERWSARRDPRLPP